MPVDKFGRYLDKSVRNAPAVRGPSSLWTTTPEGDFDVRRKRLRHLGDPLDEDDAATKKFVLDRTKEAGCEDKIARTEKFYTERIDPLLIEIKNGLAALAPLVASYRQGAIPSISDVRKELNRQKQEHEKILGDTAQAIVGDLTRRVDNLERTRHGAVPEKVIDERVT